MAESFFGPVPRPVKVLTSPANIDHLGTGRVQKSVHRYALRMVSFARISSWARARVLTSWAWSILVRLLQEASAQVPVVSWEERSARDC
jgi:hypothetical protein